MSDYTLGQLMPQPRRRRPNVLLAAALGVVALIVIGVGTIVAVHFVDERTKPPAQVIDGIPAPDPRCVHDVTDLSHPWISDGWWAGYVDGQARQMTSKEAMALSLGGHKVNGVWLCPPRR